MTKLKETPKVIHILECDEDRNTRTVRYYREDIIEHFTDMVNVELRKIKTESDRPQMEKSDERGN